LMDDGKGRSGNMRKTISSFLAVVGIVIVAVAPGQSRAANPTLITLVRFNGVNGSSPAASLIADANGNLFGTTFEGGPSFQGGSTGDGTVFEIAKTPRRLCQHPHHLGQVQR
jgi:hypothetical protein